MWRSDLALAVHNGPILRRGPARLLYELLAAPGLSSQQLLPVDYREQEQTNWCWAACCQMLAAFLGRPNLRQCDIAERQFHGGCCAAPSSSGCDRGEWPEVAYPANGIQLDRIDSALSRVALQAELDAGRAVEVYYVWQGGRDAHVALVTGYYSNGDFEVLDPARAFGPGRRTFDWILSAYGLGQWRLTYTNIRA